MLASTLASALGHDSGPADPGYDVVWVLLGALTSAMAHGYAHAIAHQVADHAPITANAVRSMLTEWPLVVAVLPTAAALLGAYVGWWGENAAINFALTLNTVALFGWGLWAARVAGRGWPASCRAGGVDLLLGLVIVGANALSH
ncbi:hypothetical protein [Streptomyces sp. NPDC051569]|uniref:hypothetical protein n=1 Tax=Streptomyces sp. NPDC051569 TaxID=3365661 RepID=UPI0037AFC458